MVSTTHILSHTGTVALLVLCLLFLLVGFGFAGPFGVTSAISIASVSLSIGGVILVAASAVSIGQASPSNGIAVIPAYCCHVC